MLKIETHGSFPSQREYILDVIFGGWLGLDWELERTNRLDTKITSPGSASEVVLPDVFFRTLQGTWLLEDSLPSTPLPIWNTGDLNPEPSVVEKEIPVIYGDKRPQTSYESGAVRLPVDIFGSAFFMLTRYEELVKSSRDEHDRFPAEASLSYKEDFLRRPIIDEYVEVLWSALKRQWPTLKRRKRRYRVVLTHDIDRPYSVKGVPLYQVARKLGGDAIKRRSPKLFLQRLSASILPDQLGDKLDPSNTFNSIMKMAEKNNIRSRFYFKAGNTSKYDSPYDLFSTRIQRLLRNIYNRGHVIGIHPSYGTLGNREQLQKEVNTLKRALDRAGVKQQVSGGRQHYLRWQAERSWDDWANAGLKEDSSVGYAAHVGFRAGTCHPYDVWSWKEEKPLDLVERPLIAMDGTLFSEQYMGLSLKEAVKLIKKLSFRTRLVNGNFVILWHNDKIRKHMKLYTQVFETNK